MLLLIGGNGFLGSHVCALADAMGRDYRIISRSDARIPASWRQRWTSARAFDGQEGDALLARASGVIYLATASAPATFADAPEKEISANVAPALEVFLRIAQKAPKAPVILVSSGGTVYGDAVQTPIPETAPLAPISPYGLGKVMIEEALAFAGRTHGLRYKILRVANPVGRFQHSASQGLVTATLNAARHNKPMTIYGDGHAVRDYVDADEVAAAIMNAADDAAFESRIWNIGSGLGRSILDIITITKQVTEVDFPLEFQAQRGIDIRSMVLNCSRAESELGWRSHRDLADIVNELWHK